MRRQNSSSFFRCLLCVALLTIVAAMLCPSVVCAGGMSEIYNLIRRGSYESALKVAGEFSDEDEKISGNEIGFIRGFLHYKLGRFKEAIVHFEKVRSYSLLKDYVLFYLGDAYLKLADYKLAANALVELVRDYPDSVWWTDARWKLALARFKEGKPYLARLNYVALKKKKPFYVTATEFDFKIGQTYFAEGNFREAYRLFKKVYMNTTNQVLAEESLDYIRKIDARSGTHHVKHLLSADTLLKVAIRMSSARGYKRQVDVLRRLLSYKISSRSLQLAEYLLADAYLGLKMYHKAEILFKKIVNHPHHSRYFKSMLGLSRLYIKQDRYDDAEKLLKIVVGSKSAGSLSYDAKYLLGFVFMDSGNYNDALRWFESVVRNRRYSYFRRRSLWGVAWCNFKLGRYKQAASLFDRMVRTYQYGVYDVSRALYWKGMSLKKLGDSRGSQKAFQQLLMNTPTYYYAFLASKYLGRHRITYEYLLSDYGACETNTKGSAGSRKQLLSTKRVEKLNDMGLVAEAAMELKRIYRGTSNSDITDMLAIMKLALNVGDFHILRMVAVDNLSSVLCGNHGREFKEVFLKAAYPYAYQDYVAPTATAFNVDPHLVYAVMREESAFKKDAVSSAGAIGLMQIIPPTASKIALELGDTTYSVEKLKMPKTNIKYGVWYLRKLLDEFEGDKVLALASYNAGKRAVNRWLVNGARDMAMEEFIEEIPYNETRRYVKKVLSSYWMYNILY